MIQSCITFDETFILQAYKRHAYTRSLRKSYLILGIAAFLLMVPIGIYMLSIGEVRIGLAALALPVIVVVTKIYEKWSIRRNLRKSSYKDDKVDILLTQEHFQATSPIQNVSLSWTVFTKALEFDDGCLIYQGDQLYNWIPSSSLVDCTFDELTSFLEQQIKSYEVVKN